MISSRLLVSSALAAVALALVPAAPTAAAPDSSPPATASAAGPDFSGYQQLLNDLLTVTGGNGAPLDSRFDYEKLYDLKGRYERFARIKHQLLDVPPSRMDERTRRAWAINTYNFLVIETATDYLLVPGRGRLRYKGVREMPVEGRGFFAESVATVENRKYSLDEFERHFLFADYQHLTGGERPATLDPRVHFAIVCGALGCPPLLPRVYRPDSLEIQLEFATRNALALPRHLAVNEKLSRLEASAIFDWYVGDFGGRDQAFDFLVRHAPAKVRAAIARHKITGIGATTAWDWNLNQTVHKKEI